MAAFVGAAALAVPAIPMIPPISTGTYMAPSQGVPAVWSRNRHAKHGLSLGCPHRKPLFAVALSNRKQFGPSLSLDQFGMRGLTSSHPLITIPVLPQRRGVKAAVMRASSSIPYNYHHLSKEKKPRWWLRTLGCLPYLMPLHLLSTYGAGAHQFVPFLDNFEILADPFSGAPLPQWFSIIYCLGIYFLVVRRKTWPYFLRFHIITAMLLENTIQIIGIVQRWLPYWTALDASFWTVVAYGLLFAMLMCIRDSIRGTYPNVPVISEAAFIHSNQP